MTILHIALHSLSEKKAEIFFGKVLNLKQEKEFILSSDLSNLFFNIRKEIKVKVFSDNEITFEIFITDKKPKPAFEHVCLLVQNIKDLIKRCKRYKIKMLTAKINNKNYLFIRDFSGYLYEIKVKKRI